MKLLGKILKIFFTSLVLAVCALFIARIFLLSDKSSLNKLIADDINRAAYAESSGNINILTHKQHDELSKEGLFGAYAFIYIEEAKQVQVTARYNDSIFKYTDHDSSSEFVYFLFNPESGRYIRASHTESSKKLMYNYRRIVFDDVDIDAGNWYLYISATISADDSFDNIPVHRTYQKFTEYSLSKKERASLEK